LGDSVKFIFKTLIKVPIFIMVTYIIFNIFAFSITYFRLLGFSQVLVQTAVRNNFIPPEEFIILQNYLDSITDTYVIAEASIVIEEEGSDIPVATERRQYGEPVTVGVQARFSPIWPLSPRDQLIDQEDGIPGFGGDFGGFAGEAELEARRAALRAAENANIRIVYTVPGLRYYPDLQ